MEVNLGLRWRLGHGNLTEASDELFHLLRAVRDLGSLSAASKQTGVSYRHAWGLLVDWAAHFGYELVELERGRGAQLSPLGESLLNAERQARARVDTVLRDLEHELAMELAASIPAGDTRSTRLRVFASHSLVLEILRTMLSTKNVQFDLHFRGSIDSLRLLSEGRCDVAGFHIADPPLADALYNHYRPWLHVNHHKLIRVVARRQGLIVAPGNPHNVKGLKDLANSQIRFINRQPDSGTRLLLDLLLARAGLQPDAIVGYDSEEFTHLAVAALVASGAADAGPGIQAAAERFGLGFIPLARETYYLAARSKALALPTMRHLLQVLRSSEFLESVAKLGGYATVGAGEELAVDEVIGSADKRSDASPVSM